MAKPKRNQSARKSKASKPATKRKPAPPVAAVVATAERQPTLPGVSPRKSAPRHFALYLTDEMRELAEKLAREISTPWKTASLNEAIRAAFLEGAQLILSRKPGSQNAAKAGNGAD